MIIALKVGVGRARDRAPRSVDHGMCTCALIRINFNSARSADTRVRVSMALNGTSSAIYAVLPLMAHHIRPLEEGRAVRKLQANSCYLLLLIRVMTTYCACVGTVTERSAFTLFIRAILERSGTATFTVPF